MFGKQLPEGAVWKRCLVPLVLLLIALLPGCIGTSSNNSTSTSNVTTSATTSSPGGSTKDTASWAFTQYSSSQFGKALPAYIVKSTNAAADLYFQYSVGSDTTSTLVAKYPIGHAVAVDPTLLTDGSQRIFLRGSPGGSGVNFLTTVSIFPTVGDGNYVGVRSITDASGKQQVRTVRFVGKRENNNIVNGVLELSDPADAPARSLAGSTAVPISASLYNSKISALELSFGQGNDYIRASGGYGAGDTGGYCDHIVLQYTGTDPALGAISGNIYLYKVSGFQGADAGRTIGFLNSTGTLQDLTTTAVYSVTLLGQTFDNFKLSGYLLLTDLASKKVYAYKAVGKAGAPDGSSNGILFSSTDNNGFYGFLTFTDAPDGVRKINQMTIHSAGVKSYTPLDSYLATSPSVSLLQPFNPWP